MTFQFSKYEGLGNDFVVVHCDKGADLQVEQVRALCDRHRGVGADGVLLTGVERGLPFMKVINADGSRPEMCGNGLRCVALYLAHQGLVDEDTFEVDTDAGPHACELSGRRESEQVQVQMSRAFLDAERVLSDVQGMALDVPFALEGRELRGTAVSMGNPHFVCFDVDDAEADVLGPLMSVDARFEAGVNAGFARLDDRGGIVLRVHERGAGWTLACGTGACAAAVAAVETGRVPRGAPVRVTLPGGDLEILVGERTEPIVMTGPARRVFDGTHALWGEGRP